MRFMVRFVTCLVFVVPAFASNGWADPLPVPSPSATVKQTVGVTELEVQYSSPGVKGRVILGKLLPFDAYWRAGANRSTSLRLSTDAKIAGKQVNAGEYRLGLIPSRAGWKLVLGNDVDKMPIDEPQKNAQVLNAKVQSKTIPSRERLTYLFENTTETTTDLVLEWSTFKVMVPIEVATAKLTESRIERSVDSAYSSLLDAGRYYARHGQPARALEKFELAKGLKETWYLNWRMAELLSTQGKKAQAVALAKDAKKLGQGDRVYEQFFKGDIDKALKDWAR